MFAENIPITLPLPFVLAPEEVLPVVTTSDDSEKSSSFVFPTHPAKVSVEIDTLDTDLAIVCYFL